MHCMLTSGVWPAVGACLLPHVGGILGGRIVNKNYEGWYTNLKKAPWNPPKYVFPIVWTTLYTGMGYASYLVWRDGGGFHGPAAKPLALYGAQLALNWAWTPIFFGLKSFKWATVEGFVLLGVATACTASFRAINSTASMIMLPYLAWMTLASTLTTYIYINNPRDSIEPKDE